MSGIVGYIHKDVKTRGIDIGLKALNRIANGEYDSAGLAFWDDVKQTIVSTKVVGDIQNLEKETLTIGEIPANPIILHTRWASKGSVSKINAHPHHDCIKNIWIAHNGNIANDDELRMILQGEGHKFNSQTDTEILVHLLEKYFKGNLEEAVRESISMIEGAFGFVAISRDDPNKIVATQMSSPLFLGIGKDDMQITSNLSAMVIHTSKVFPLEYSEIGVITGKAFKVLREKKQFTVPNTDFTIKTQLVDKTDWLDHLSDLPKFFASLIQGRIISQEGKVVLGGLNSVSSKLININKVYIITDELAMNAGLFGEYLFEEYAGLITKSDLASEFRQRNLNIDAESMILAISYSGEDINLVKINEEAKIRGALTIGVTNVVGSTIAKNTHAGVYTRIGQEYDPISIKSFLSTIIVILLIAIFLGKQKSLSYTKSILIINDLKKLPELTNNILELVKELKSFADKHNQFDKYLVIGSKYFYPMARELAYRMKGISRFIVESYRPGQLNQLLVSTKKFKSLVFYLLANNIYDSQRDKLIQELKKNDIPTIFVTERNSHNLSDTSIDLSYMPEISEPFNAFLSFLLLTVLLNCINDDQ